MRPLQRLGSEFPFVGSNNASEGGMSSTSRGAILRIGMGERGKQNRALVAPTAAAESASRVVEPSLLSALNLIGSVLSRDVSLDFEYPTHADRASRFCHANGCVACLVLVRAPFSSFSSFSFSRLPFLLFSHLLVLLR